VPLQEGGVTDLFTNHIGKVVRMLASDRDSVALDGCRALRVALTEARLSIDWVANVLEAAWPPTMVAPKPKQKDPDQPKPKAPDPRKPWQQEAADLLEHPEILGKRGNRRDEALLHREIDFLNVMRRARFAPSAGQQKWLNDVANRLGQGSAA
jgi:hypothetical protein